MLELNSRVERAVVVATVEIEIAEVVSHKLETCMAAMVEAGTCGIEPLWKSQSQTANQSLEYEETPGASRQFSTSETSNKGT